MFQRVLNNLKSGGLTPSFSILISKDNQIVFEDYFNSDCNSIYDIASLTKPLLTFPLSLKYTDLNDKVYKYIKDFPNILTIKNLITHTSGLIPWLPLYLYNEDYLKTIKKFGFNKSDSKEKQYSCLNYIVLKNIIELSANLTFRNVSEKYLKNLNEVYIPPVNLENVMPTEIGNNFEYQLAKKHITCPEKTKFRLNKVIKGETHDLNAFYDGQISGNSGLFATSKGVSNLIEKLLTYNNYKLSLNENEKYLYHLGFTGTGFAISKNSKNFVVFLSNRVYPEVKNIDFSSIRHKIFETALNNLN